MGDNHGTLSDRLSVKDRYNTYESGKGAASQSRARTHSQITEEVVTCRRFHLLRSAQRRRKPGRKGRGSVRTPQLFKASPSLRDERLPHLTRVWGTA